MSASNIFSKNPEDHSRTQETDDGMPLLMGGVELIDCDEPPAAEEEIPEDPNRWTLPDIREGAAVALFVCMAPAVVACVAAAGVGTLALLTPNSDE